jgi:hypothetical protein
MFGLSTIAVASAQTPVPEGKGGDVKPEVRTTTARKSASGTVKSASGDTVVVVGREKGKDVEWAFAVDGKTMIKANGKSIVATDLKPGGAVQVRYSEQDGRTLAHAISVKSTTTAKKKAEKPSTTTQPVEKK